MAVYFHGLTQKDSNSRIKLPIGYSIDQWDHSKYSTRSQNLDIGTIVCAHCGIRKKHQLSWPEDAYFQISHKQQVLWAFNRDSALDLLDYIESERRDRNLYQYSGFLMKIPKHFLSKKTRDTVIKRIKLLLS